MYSIFDMNCEQCSFVYNTTKTYLPDCLCHDVTLRKKKIRNAYMVLYNKDHKQTRKQDTRDRSSYKKEYYKTVARNRYVNRYKFQRWARSLCKMVGELKSDTKPIQDI